MENGGWLNVYLFLCMMGEVVLEKRREFLCSIKGYKKKK